MRLHQLLPWYEERHTGTPMKNAAVRALLATGPGSNRQRRDCARCATRSLTIPTLTTNVTLNWRRLQARMGSSHMITYVPMTTHWLAIAALAFLALGVANVLCRRAPGPVSHFDCT